MTQFGLPFDWPVPTHQDEFIVTEANRRAVHFLEGWGRWPVAAVIISGPRKSGRSLLARIFAAKSGGTVFDDAERGDEEALFHRWNDAQEVRAPLFIICDDAPPRWRVALPDLASRLAATPHIAIGPPDVPLIEALLMKLLKQRSLLVGSDVVRYLAARVERSYVSILRVVDALDQLALSAKRAITIPLARQALAAIGVHTEERMDVES